MPRYAQPLSFHRCCTCLVCCTCRYRIQIILVFFRLVKMCHQWWQHALLNLRGLIHRSSSHDTDSARSKLPGPQKESQWQWTRLLRYQWRKDYSNISNECKWICSYTTFHCCYIHWNCFMYLKSQSVNGTTARLREYFCMHSCHKLYFADEISSSFWIWSCYKTKQTKCTIVQWFNIFPV